MEKIIKSYADQSFHKKISLIIKKLSKNKEDIRNEVKKIIDFKLYHRLLDLGCGYGWFLEALPEGFDFIMGVDYNDENESAFLSLAQKKAKKALFKKLFLPSKIDMPSCYFDMIVSAYSLYFFPDMLQEIKRLLDPKGVFIVITHSSHMLEEGERFFKFDNLRKLIESFSAENGYNILKQYFDHVEYYDYPNELIFHEKDSHALEQYIDFKSAFIEQDVDPETVKVKLLKELKEKKFLSFNKNDKIFIARP
ncbi:MAG TPA: class I SAM-dependent methyltransferase [Syntrophorhabdaceae bacterium]|nr:class I SAM-dependent methyltransferase [Syntrophorhabdaceae bacterium]HPU28761.1 class I SAM-dependent methyltransferase [Syntrophorhabdaceae bacterium]